jgi:hypothetical protein
MTLKHRLRNVPGLMWHWTAGSEKQEPVFRGLLEKIVPTRILEIGTHQGISTALLAEYADVTTVDILPNPVRAVVWDTLKPIGKITEVVCKSQGCRDAAIAAAAAGSDLVFIDGCHLWRDVEHDHGLVENVPHAIFHDYWLNAEDWPDVKEYVDTLPSRHVHDYRKSARHFTVHTSPPFAWVEVSEWLR